VEEKKMQRNLPRGNCTGNVIYCFYDIFPWGWGAQLNQETSIKQEQQRSTTRTITSWQISNFEKKTPFLLFSSFTFFVTVILITGWDFQGLIHHQGSVATSNEHETPLIL